MAPKPRPLPSPSSSSSSSSAADSASSSSDDDAKAPSPKPSQTTVSPSKKPSTNPKNPPPPPAAAASDESSDSSDSESDSPPSAAKPDPPPAAAEDSGDSDDASSEPAPPPPRRPSRSSVVKPLASKPMDSASKRPPVTPEKRKLSDLPHDENGPSAKKLFQRVWSPEDEIAVLEGMIEFQAKHGNTSDPFAVGDSFYEFIRKSLKLELTKSQISDKLRRLKKKFQSNLKRSRNGADPNFGRTHEKTSFELSKRIWSSKESSGEEEGSEAEEESKRVRKNSQFRVNYPNLKVAIDLVEKEGWSEIAAGTLKRGLEQLKPARAKALEERWAKHFIAGAKFMLERAELKKDLIKTLVSTLDSNSS